MAKVQMHEKLFLDNNSNKNSKFLATTTIFESTV